MGSQPSPRTSRPLVFDSDVLIWLMRGSETARDLFQATPYENRIMPAVVAMEILRGCRNALEKRRVRAFVDASFVSVTQISEEISRRAIAVFNRYALSHRPATADCLIAATALTLRAPLATANGKDYRFINQLELATFNP